MFFRNTTVTLLLIAITFVAAAQRNKPLIDSLERQLPVLKDSVLANTYSELAWQYRAIDRDKAIRYGKKAISLSRKLNYLAGLAQAYNDVGILYFDKEQYDSSVILYKESLKIRERTGDGLGQARLYNKIGIVYQKRGDFSTALDNQLKALVLFEKAHNDIGISYSLNNIGILNQNMSRYEEALSYHDRSVAIKQKINDRSGLLQSYVNMANIYKIFPDYERAEEYYLKALDMAQTLDNKEYLSNIQNNLGELYHRKKDYPNAIKNITASYNTRQELGDTKGTVSCLTNLAAVYIDMHRTDTASQLLAKAEKLALDGVNTRPELITVYQTYSTLYEATGDIHNSLELYKRHVAVKDTLYTEQMGEKFAELETRYQTLEKDKRIQQQQLELNQQLYDISQQKLRLSEADLLIAGNELEIKKQNERILDQQLETEKKEYAIQSLSRENRIKELELKNQALTLNRRNTTLFAVIGFSLMAALLGASFYRRRKLAQEAAMQAALIRQQDIATKAVLDAEDKERKRIAGDLHDSVGQMMSAVKVNLGALKDEIPFNTQEQQDAYDKLLSLVDQSCKEVRTVSHNIMPNALQKAGLANGISDFVKQIDPRVLKIDLYTDGLDQAIEANVEAVLYRVIQECVNNVLKHSGANRLDISIINDKDGISATLEDNGKGFDTNNISGFRGIGLKNIITRVNYLKGTVEWNSSPGKGTVVAIFVPAQAINTTSL